MHQTLGEDYVVISGNRLFRDSQPPTIKGTRIPASSMNAMQMEICNVITMNGGTLATDGATDATAGWHQLYDMIFQSSKIGLNALADNSISASKLGTGCVVTAKLGDGAVTDIKLSANSVTNSKLATNSVSTTKIQDLAITTPKLNNGAVTSDKLGGSSVTWGKIAWDAVERASMRFPDVWSRIQRKQVGGFGTSGHVGALDINLNQGYVGSSMAYRISLNALLYCDTGGYARLHIKDQAGNQLFDTGSARPVVSLDLLNGAISTGNIQGTVAFSDVIQIDKGDITQLQVWAEFNDGAGAGQAGALRISFVVEEIMVGYIY